MSILPGQRALMQQILAGTSDTLRGAFNTGPYRAGIHNSMVDITVISAMQGHLIKWLCPKDTNVDALREEFRERHEYWRQQLGLSHESVLFTWRDNITIDTGPEEPAIPKLQPLTIWEESAQVTPELFGSLKRNGVKEASGDA